MSTFKISVIILSIGLFSDPTLAAPVFSDSKAAMEQIDLQRSKQLSNDLRQQLEGVPAKEATEILQAFVSSHNQAITETEYALWQLALSARQPSGDLLDLEVLNYLLNYSSRSRVQHPESADYTLPLFNIRAAAAGALSLRQRQKDLVIAQSLELQPAALLKHYLQTSPLSQAALRQAAIDLPAAQRTQLLTIGLQRLQQPNLSQAESLALIDINSDLAFESGNATALAAIIATDEGLRLPRVLTQLSDKFPAEQSKTLLYQATALSPQLAAIAISELAAFASTDKQVYSSLLDWLGEPQLGSVAALALSGIKSPDLIADLRQLSVSRQRVTASNAGLALSLLAESTREQQQ